VTGTGGVLSQDIFTMQTAGEFSHQPCPTSYLVSANAHQCFALYSYDPLDTRQRC